MFSKIKRFLQYSRPHLFLGITGVLLLTVGSALSFVFPLASKYFIDSVIPSRDFKILAEFSLALVVLYLLKGVIEIIGSYLSTVFRENVIRDLQLKLMAHALNLKMEVMERMRLGDITSRIMSDVTNLRSLFADNFFQLLKDLLTLITGLGLMLWLDIRLTLLSILPLIVLLFFANLFASKLKAKVKSLQEKVGTLTTLILDPLYNFVVLKAYLLQQYSLAKAKFFFKEFVSEKISVDLLRNLASQSAFFMASFASLIVLWHGGGQIMQGNLSLGKLVAFSFLLSQLASLVQKLSNLNLQIKTALASLERMDQLLAMPIESDGYVSWNENNNYNQIDFKEIEFTYQDGRKALRNLSFSIQRGQTVALVGPSGSGKSTVMKLLLKLYDLQKGDITIDGVSFRLLPPSDVRRFISFVPQEDHLFPGTIEENIRIGKFDSTEAEIIEAAKAARVHEFVCKFPQQYKTPLGERGVNLSGGERQRISLARAFLRNTPIIILDEAASQLDSDSEVLIRQAMRQIFKGKTVIVIAHRLSTVIEADQIVVMDKGVVIDIGKHQDLYNRCPLYRNLCDKQFIRITNQKEIMPIIEVVS